jgi:hypothetical protein
LRAEHVYLGKPVVVVDCIEFNDRFRHVDSLDDVCFLASDLERLNRADLADYLVSAYRRRLRDAAPDALVSFYKSYRDGVRAKVAGLRAAQESAAERQADCDRALKHLHRALRTMRDWHTPFLIVMCGLSGSGKSTIAARLSARLGAQLLASDRVRKSLFGLAPLERCSDPALYGPQAHVKTYAALRESAGKLLGERATVVLDATFLRRGDRASVTELAGQLSVPLRFVECRCPVEAARDRIRNRQAAGSDPSDAGVAVLESQRERYESPSEIPADRFLPVDTEHPPEELVGQIVSRLALL